MNDRVCLCHLTILTRRNSCTESAILLCTGFKSHSRLLLFALKSTCFRCREVFPLSMHVVYTKEHTKNPHFTFCAKILATSSSLGWCRSLSPKSLSTAWTKWSVASSNVDSAISMFSSSASAGVAHASNRRAKLSWRVGECQACRCNRVVARSNYDQVTPS